MLSAHPGPDRFHLVDGGEGETANVVASNEILNVAVEVIGAYAGVGALAGSFEHVPRGLDFVGVAAALDALSEQVLDRLVPERQLSVGSCVVRPGIRSRHYF